MITEIPKNGKPTALVKTPKAPKGTDVAQKGNTGVILQPFAPSPLESLSSYLATHKVRTERGYNKLIQRWVREFGKHTVLFQLEQLRHGAMNGNIELIKEGLKVHGLLGSGGGITINNLNQNTNNNTAGSVAASRGFDTVMRKLAQQERQTIDMQSIESAHQADSPE